MNGDLYYGLANQQEAVMIARRVCDVLGHGSNGTAVQMLVETAAQETLLGAFKDPYPYRHGVGLTQIDPIGFTDTKQRIRKHHAEKIKKHFGLNIQEVQHRELAFSPFLSLLWCRMFYLLRPQPIPTTVRGRAEYWKTHYNTAKGAGTVEEYIENATQIRVIY